MKNVLVQGIVAVEVVNGRGGDQEIENVLEDFEPFEILMPLFYCLVFYCNQ